MNISSAPTTLFSLLLSTVLSASPVSAQSLFSSSDKPVPTITLAKAEILADIPTPMQGNDINALLAQAAGGGLSAAKEASSRAFSAQLRSKLDNGLRTLLTEEEVPVGTDSGALTLHHAVDIAVIKQLSGLDNRGDYEIEQGNLSASGDFHLRLQAPDGALLIDKHLDIADLRLKGNYEIRTPLGDGTIEDDTEAQLTVLCDTLVKRILDRIDGDLKASNLQKLATSQ
ncbi:hypothetical protein PVT68_11825 [Microbulbifer bruguierae]|uniref:Uncharacterized protein n=1 Tax=Microbulbifer bruguierae TaxID=3029061 RepID=A0ABY8NBK4_9GAMM|nr:hypothetical protein [Microbulbifer bruguierae]WGL15457.1 hypothetical protein PVT68_11825 [Microbulbifer bruguierae]